jgi:catalase
MLEHLEKINDVLAKQVAKGIGEKIDPTAVKPKSKTSKGTADTPEELEILEMATTPTTASGGLLKTKGLSMEEDQPKLAKGRKVAILVAAGVAVDQVEAMQSALQAGKVLSEIVAPHVGEVEGDGGVIEATKTFANSSSVLFDAVYVPGGLESVGTLTEMPDALRFVDEAYKHGKPIAASAEGVDLIKKANTGKLVTDEDAAEQGVLYASDAKSLASDFIEAIANHRFHDRPVDKIMA